MILFVLQLEDVGSDGGEGGLTLARFFEAYINPSLPKA